MRITKWGSLCSYYLLSQHLDEMDQYYQNCTGGKTGFLSQLSSLRHKTVLCSCWGLWEPTYISVIFPVAYMHLYASICHITSHTNWIQYSCHHRTGTGLTRRGGTPVWTGMLSGKHCSESNLPMVITYQKGKKNPTTQHLICTYKDFFLS